MTVTQMNFSKLITFFGNYHSFVLNRFAIINCTQIAALKTESENKLDILPERPKKPATSFFLFVKDRREDLKETNPNLKLSLVSQKLSKEWSELDPLIKEKYVTQYNNAMKSYLQKFLEYNSKLTDAQKQVIKKINEEKAQEKKNKILKKTIQSLNKPKRPKGSFIYFALEYYEKEKAAGGKFRDFLIKSKPIWDNLSEAERQKFNVLYAIDKKRYDLEMELWETKMVKAGHQDLVRQYRVTQHTTPIRQIKERYHDRLISSEGSSKSSD